MREEYTIDAINELITRRLASGRSIEGGDQFRVGSAYVAYFDEAFRLDQTAPRHGRARRLTVIANDALPGIQARFPEFRITVTPGQEYTSGRTGYLVYSLTCIGILEPQRIEEQLLEPPLPPGPVPLSDAQRQALESDDVVLSDAERQELESDDEEVARLWAMQSRIL